MKINVEELINSVSKYPMIYNPDHKDFSNAEVRTNVFDTLISKDMKGIKGQRLNHKWNQILNKYANFIRKLSADDSSESVLTAFMNWPWTRHMRIFKPYVRKQFKIPEFQPAIQISDIANFPTEIDVPGFEPELQVAEIQPGMQMSRFQPGMSMPFIGNMSMPSTSYGNYPFQSIALMMGLSREAEEDFYAENNMDTDQDSNTDEEPITDGESSTDDVNEENKAEQPAAKIRRLEEKEVNTRNDDTNSMNNNSEESSNKHKTNVLPDLPQPNKTAITERNLMNFTAQEHMFLAWAKTLSTFTPKRQALVKLKINKIISEAEMEDLDDEFFAANTPPQRSIYTAPH